MSKRSEPRSYPYPPATIFAAVHAGLPHTKLKITGADPNQGTIWADKSMSFASWGEKVTVYIYPGQNGQTEVTVDSALKFGLVAWGAHTRNFQTVFEAIDRGLYQTGAGAGAVAPQAAVPVPPPAAGAPQAPGYPPAGTAPPPPPAGY